MFSEYISNDQTANVNQLIGVVSVSLSELIFIMAFGQFILCNFEVNNFA